MTRLLGWIWWWLLPIRKQVAIENFRGAFPERRIDELRTSLPRNHRKLDVLNEVVGMGVDRDVGRDAGTQRLGVGLGRTPRTTGGRAMRVDRPVPLEDLRIGAPIQRHHMRAEKRPLESA